jgi:phosphoribosylformylglycinamidine cyclo-ligase
LVRGMSAACVEAEISLVGGETAEMPAVYAKDDLDVVGFVTGVVDREKVLTGAEIVAGDVLYGVNSSGLHTNGWSLARKVLFERGGYAIDARPEELGGATLAEVLLAPHANYVMAIRKILDAGIPVKGMAHITGGGLVENVPRILPEGLGALIDRRTWLPQPIFGLMQTIGSINDLEMHRTFNMGVGLVIAAPAGLQNDLAAAIAGFPALRVWELGRVEVGDGVKFGGV